jgi:hypothetical protein
MKTQDVKYLDTKSRSEAAVSAEPEVTVSLLKCFRPQQQQLLLFCSYTGALRPPTKWGMSMHKTGCARYQPCVLPCLFPAAAES